MIKLINNKKSIELTAHDINLLYNALAAYHNSIIRNLPQGTRMGICEEEKLAFRSAQFLDVLRDF